MNHLRRLQVIEKRLAERAKPKAVLTYSDPLFFARHTLQFQPDPWQERVLRWSGDRLLLNCSRQAGKSTVSAVLALHRAVFFARSLILLISPSLRQSGELFRKAKDFFDCLPVKPPLIEDNRLSMQLANGSRIVSLPGATDATIRGFSAPSLVIEDESAFVSDAIFLATKPMLATSGGKMILMSTPHGRRGHFHETWKNGGNEWERIRVRVHDVPRISPEFIESERASMPRGWFASEYECEFLETEDSVFSFDDVQRAMSEDVKPLFPVMSEILHH